MKELLTGKCETDFYNWFLLNNGLIDLSTKFYEEFLEYPSSMQFGVLVDFFYENKVFTSYDPVPIIMDKITLEEARIEAIKESVKIYNNR